MRDDQRRHPRHRVHLRVAYRTAREFVEQYAQNLSAGGLFVEGAHPLAVLDVVTVEVELPGHGKFTLTAEVAHVVPASAKRVGGAGLQIKDPPAAFTKAIGEYLIRLGKRRSTTVYVGVEPWRQALIDAGYIVAAPPAPRTLASAALGGKRVGVVAPDDVAQQYAAAFAFLGGDPSAIVPVSDKIPVDSVVAWLDDKLLGS